MTQTQRGESLRRVAIVGGTHGNELTGPHLLRHFGRNLDEVTRPSFRTELVLANARAFEAGRRFIDEDLNRAFRPETLIDPNPASYEAQRAAVLNQQLGPKGGDTVDLIIDLHSTTSRAGGMLIILDLDPLSLQICAWLCAREPAARVLYIPPREGAQPYLGSISPCSVVIEVGPVAQNLLRADVYDLSRRLVGSALDFVEARNRGDALALPETVEVFRVEGSVPWPKEAPHYYEAMVHEALQDRDYQPLKAGDPLFRRLDGSEVFYEGEEEVWPVFINEAAYYEKGYAMSLTSRHDMVVPPVG